MSNSDDGQLQMTSGLCPLTLSSSSTLHLPASIISTTNNNRVTWGGVNGPICHGAGRTHGTVNDYVRAVEYVDANGVHRTVSDSELLKAAAGCFGLLGVVTHITFELDKMSYAVMQPVKPDIGLAIPPMSRDDIPIALMKTFSQKQYDDALRDFENRAENHYYAEWFVSLPILSSQGLTPVYFTNMS